MNILTFIVFVQLRSQALGKAQTDNPGRFLNLKRILFFLPNLKMNMNTFVGSKWPVQLVLLGKKEIQERKKIGACFVFFVYITNV